MVSFSPWDREIRLLALIAAAISFTAAARIQLLAVETDSAVSPSADAAAADAAAPAAAAPAAVGSPEYKQVASSILSQAQEAYSKGDLKEARRLANDAARIQVQWNADELTPRQFLSQLPSSQENAAQQSSAAGSDLHSPEYTRLARDLLREARDYLHHGDFDEAEELAAAADRLGTEWWKGEQTPAKLLAEIRKARRFQSSASVTGRGQRNQGFVYVSGDDQGAAIAPVVASSRESHSTGQMQQGAALGGVAESPGRGPAPQLILPLPEEVHAQADASLADFVTDVKADPASHVGYLEDDAWSEAVVRKGHSLASQHGPQSGVLRTQPTAESQAEDLAVFKVAVSELSSAVRELRQSVHDSQQSQSTAETGDQNPGSSQKHASTVPPSLTQRAPSPPAEQHWPTTVAPAVPQPPGFGNGQLMSPYPPIIIQNYPSIGAGGHPAQWQTSYYTPNVPAPGAAPVMPTAPVAIQPAASDSGSSLPWIICGLLLICVVLFGRQIDDARGAAIAWFNSRSASDESSTSSRRSRVSDADEDDFEDENPRAMILSVLDQNMDLREKLSA